MTSATTDRHHDDSALTLQKAIVVVHRQVRRSARWRLGMICALACAFSAGSRWDGRSHPALYQTGLVVATLLPLAVSAAIGRYESRRLNRAAALQAAFDGGHGTAAGIEADDDEWAEVRLLAGRWVGDGADTTVLTSWYPSPPGRTEAFGRAFRVWVNASWDAPLRRTAARHTMWFGVAWLAAGLLAHRTAGASWAKVMVQWVAPSAAVFEWVIGGWFGHRDLAEAKGDLAERVARRLRLGNVTDADAAAFQAELLALRRNAPRVGERIQRRAYDDRLAAVNHFVAELANAG